ncbi:MAG: helix-turn-helix domain-containing protein [Selenomonadaceae bacterium]|nr:helix-turn-helix domain-containing protein [Selenomonadaceae bacterium]MBR0287983.1 helix-turn-helix domain-containing protein [Selenomonadaceae bacterium]
MYHIYKITNRLNGKIYVGQTRQPIEKRFLQHSKADSPLGQAIRDCGIENFTIEVIEECTTPDTAQQQEMFWVKALNCRVPNGYNRSAGGEGTFSSKPKPTTPPKKINIAGGTIAESLKRFRAELQLSQKEVAETLSILPQAYSRYETGKYIPRADDIAKLATAYNVTTDYLLGLSDSPRPKSQEVRDKEFFECVQNHTLAVLEALRKAGGVEVDKATAAVSVEQD